MNVLRGDIYYVHGSGRLGREDVKAGRPAVVVSGPEVIADTDAVSVVYLTTHPWSESPTHVTIRATGKQSVALCEHVSTVAKADLGDLCGVCTAADMAKIDDALMLALGIVEAEALEDPDEDEDIEEDESVESVPEMDPETAKMLVEAVRVQGERDAYKAMVDKLLAERWER